MINRLFSSTGWSLFSNNSSTFTVEEFIENHSEVKKALSIGAVVLANNNEKSSNANTSLLSTSSSSSLLVMNLWMKISYCCGLNHGENSSDPFVEVRMDNNEIVHTTNHHLQTYV